MGTLLDLASLVMIPSGYKEDVIYSQIPTDGSGDLDFTRASNATRVNSAGLIEKVRTNLILQSNTFDTTWFAGGTISVTSGQSGYDGSSDAWLLDKTQANAHYRQDFTFDGSIVSYSFYVKAGTLNWVNLNFGGTNSFFDLSGGVTGVTTAITSSIQDIGGGWYRCTAVNNYNGGSSLRIYPADADNDTSGTSGNIYIQDAQLETGDIATDYIPTTSAAVSVGMTADVPRLDYTGGGCPKLLLEPQRTNLKTSSEDATGWGNPIRITTSLNVAISPDGYVNADKIIETATNDTHRFDVGFSATNGATYTFSYFAKAAERTQCHIHGYGDNGVFNISTAIFDLSNGTILSNTGGGTASIVSYGNGWYRVSLTLTAAATALGYWGFGLALNGTTSYLGVLTNGALFYGIQLELGSYPTSYIPTLGASVTRVADAASKTGISSLIGQTEGTMYLEFNSENLESYTQRILTVSDNTNNNAIGFQLSAANQITFYVVDGGVGQVVITKSAPAITLGQTTKVAAAYKANDFVLYINGVQVGTDTSGSVPATSVLQYANPGGTTPYIGKVAQTLLFPTRLSNTQLAELTTL